MRLTSEFWVSALIRRINATGAFAALGSRGATEAGAIFIRMRNASGLYDLFGPAPQSFYEDSKPRDRQFTPLLTEVPEAETETRLASERRFDPDLWLVEIEDYRGDIEKLVSISR